MERRENFGEKLAIACPALPHMALGLWLAWLCVARSGSSWLSDTAVDGANIATMFIVVDCVLGVGLLLATFGLERARGFLERPSVLVCGGLLSSLGCLLIIVIGPYYLYSIVQLSFMTELFYLGCAMAGAGATAIVFRCTQMYAALPPRKVVLYVAVSHIIAVGVYFTVMGAPAWRPAVGGPTFACIVAFVGLPIASALLALLSHYAKRKPDESQFEGSRSRFPVSFWKLLVVVVVFSFIVMSVHAVIAKMSSVDTMLEVSRASMILRIVMAMAFACAAVVLDSERLDFGKFFSGIMAACVAAIVLLPIVGVLDVLWHQVVGLVANMFEFVLWCILAFVSYQKKISPILVFGFCYGGFMLGSGLGWAVGAFGFSRIAGTSADTALYVTLAIVVLLCVFFLFTERDFDRLFKPQDEREQELDVLFERDFALSKDEGASARGEGKLFSRAIESISEDFGLSQRERDVLRCLALGYDSNATSNRLSISWNTVRTHTRRLYAKLGIHSKASLVELVDERIDEIRREC